MISLNPDTDIQLGGGGTSDEKIASQKATKEYVDNSFDSPTSLTINGPESITTTAGAGEADYSISNSPEWASGFKDVNVDCSDGRVTISSVTKRSFHVAVSGFSSSADIDLVLTATGNDGTALSMTKTVSILSTIIINGVKIQHKNRSVYTREEWEAHVPAFDASDARGIAVGDGTHSFCLYKDASYGTAWSTNTSVKVDVGGFPYTTESYASAATDFGGKANTDAIFEYKASHPDYSAPAFEYARNNTFGSEAYLPAGGELIMICNSTNSAEIAACSDVIGGNLSSMFSASYYPWSSTQHSESIAWGWDSKLSNLTTDHKRYVINNNSRALACVAL